MDRRIREVVRLLPFALFSPPGNLEVTSNGDGNKAGDRQLVERLARKVNLSASRLRALFKAEMGVTPSQYIKQLRMDKAKELAETTHLTTARIIAEVWGGDESHFRREFKKALGKTLTECRKLFDQQAEAESDEEDGSKKQPVVRSASK